MKDRFPVSKEWRAGENRGAAPPMPPFVSTKQFMSLAHITKSQRTNMQKAGVCEPVKVIQDGKHYYYTLDQLQEVDLASVMLANGMRYDEVGKVFEDDPDAVGEVAYRCAEENQRASRRTVKRMAFLRKRAKGAREVVGEEGWYLRYLPNRWFALIPATSGDALFGSPDRLARSFGDLISIADVVGWARTTLLGALTSFSSDGRERTSWQLVELSSPPTPVVTGSLVVDGGCYRTVHADGGNPECDILRCFECCRYGREPTDDERMRWGEADIDHPELWNSCLMAKDLADPYRYGMWSDFTSSYMSGGMGDSGSGAPRKPCPTLRPRLMPQVFKLPMGVTACAMPAGVYLCIQDRYSEGDEKPKRILDTLRGLERFPFTDAMEDDAVRRFQEAHPSKPPHPPMRSPHHGGPYLEPFAMPRGGGDPKYFTWNRRLLEEELGQLRIPYNMALWPQDGFVVAAEMMPDVYATGNVVKEFQVYVDPGTLGPEGYRVFDGDMGFMKS